MIWWVDELLFINVLDDVVLMLFVLGMLANVHGILHSVLTVLKVNDANSSFFNLCDGLYGQLDKFRIMFKKKLLDISVRY